MGTADFKTVRVTLDVTARLATRDDPARWNWHDVCNIDGVNDNLNVVEVVELPLNGNHVHQMEES
jgi:hypothetical protein